MTGWFARLNWSQRIGAAFGAVYILIGVVGFAVTAGVGFAALRGKDLILFELNPLHNLVHLGIGAALLYAALNSARASRLMNRLIGGTYLLVAVAGAFVVEADTSLFRDLVETRSHLNILALNHPDNLLHLASAIVLIGSTFIVSRRGVGEAGEAAEAGGTSEETGEKVAVVQTRSTSSSDTEAVARPAKRGRFMSGDAVPKSGSYSCACGQFAVAIRQGRELPDCPEPTGTDDDHYFTLRPSRSKTTAKSKARPRSSKAATRGRRPTPARG